MFRQCQGNRAKGMPPPLMPVSLLLLLLSRRGRTPVEACACVQVCVLKGRRERENGKQTHSRVSERWRHTIITWASGEKVCSARPHSDGSEWLDHQPKRPSPGCRDKHTHTNNSAQFSRGEWPKLKMVVVIQLLFADFNFTNTNTQRNVVSNYSLPLNVWPIIIQHQHQ